MKATINAAGVLCVTSETELESYALKKWSEETYSVNHVVDGSKILIDVSVGAGIWLKEQIQNQ